MPERLTPGDVVLIRRPVHKGVLIDRETGEKIAGRALRDARLKRDYPERKILAYYIWSWETRKLLFRGKFHKIFFRGSSNVCTATCFEHSYRAGCWPGLTGNDAIPDGYYPARLGWTPLFSDIARVRIVAGTNQTQET